MTTDFRQSTENSDCAHFHAQLGAYMERDLDAAEQAWMQRHRAECAACHAVVHELDQLVAEAGALPDVQPARDLWAGIESRLEAPVIPLPTAARTERTSRTRSVSVQWFAVAATLLVAVSSGVTWQIARSRAASSTGASPVVASQTTADSVNGASLAAPTAELVVASPSAVPATASRATRLAGNGDEADALNVNGTYEREISALRHIVDERFTELDPGTVTELRRNLDIIDRAIGDSRAALARDPRSGMVSAQLDRALQAKLELLRRVALL